MDTLKYAYRFVFPSGRTECFQIELNSSTMTPIESLESTLPEWARLEFKQCGGCTLDPAEHPYCPLAGRIAPMVEHMKDVVSIDEVDVTVTLDERIVTRSATAQEGMSSLMGIIIATSGCPFTEFFKPMARFHLPFASAEETFYRAASMYMLGQYYRWQSDLSVDFDMKGLPRYYENVSRINKGMADRLRATRRQDGSLNAIVLLDMFATGLPDQLEEILDQLEPLFACYLKEKNIV